MTSALTSGRYFSELVIIKMKDHTHTFTLTKQYLYISFLYKVIRYLHRRIKYFNTLPPFFSDGQSSRGSFTPGRFLEIMKAIERFKITNTANGKRKFVQRDHSLYLCGLLFIISWKKLDPSFIHEKKFAPFL